MNNLAPQFFVFIFCSLIMGFAAVSLLVAGIMIAANKLKQTKVLGISYIITGLSSLSVFVYNALLNFTDGGKVIVFGDAVMVFTMICVFASALCSCIYIHKNYGLKQIYVPVLLLPFVVLLADAGAVLLLTRTLVPDMKQAMLISLVNDVNNILTVVLIAVVIIIVLYRNREKEKVIPDAWRVKLITVIWGIVEIIVISIIYMSVIATYKTGDYDTASTNTVIFLSVVQAVDSVVTIIVPVYVLSRVRNTSKQEKTA